MAKNKKKPSVNSKATNPQTANPMWGGQFANGPAEIMAKINASIDFDSKLYAEDIEGSIAHATMLAATNILSKKEVDEIIQGLKTILQEIESGKFIFKQELEDIHMNIEARLAELIGDVAGKLHTARSRNDQAVLDFRLYVRKANHFVDEAMQALQAALIKKSRAAL